MTDITRSTRAAIQDAMTATLYPDPITHGLSVLLGQDAAVRHNLPDAFRAHRVPIAVRGVVTRAVCGGVIQ